MAQTSEKLRQLDDRFMSFVRSWVWLAGLAVGFFVLGLVNTPAGASLRFAIAALLAFGAGVAYGRRRS